MSELMRAAVFEREGVLTIKEVPVPELQNEDQVLVEVDTCSICGTDVHITAVPPGYIATENTILWHEFVGWVVKKGTNVTHLAPGDHVVVNPNYYCGKCVYCRKNLPNECEHIEALGIDYDGAFAKYCRVYGTVAYKISPDVPMDVAACAEPLACAVNGLKKVHVIPGDSVAVIGGGPIGLMLAMLLKASGAGRIYLLELAEYRVEFAKKLGFMTVVNPREQDAAALIRSETGIGADIVYDVTGSQIKAAVDLVRKGGDVVLFGVNKRAKAELAQCEITTKEITVHGTWLANATFPEAVRILEQQVIDLRPLITDVIPLDQLGEGIRKLARGQAIKVNVKP